MTRSEFLTDGATVLLGGVDEGNKPLLLRPDQVSRAINITFRGGFAKTRPAFDKKGLLFGRSEFGMWFYFHFMQGAEYYESMDGAHKLVCAVGGRIFLIDPNNGFIVTDITPRKFTTTTAIFTPSNSTILVTIPVLDSGGIFPGYPIYIAGKEYLVDSKSGNTIFAYPMEAQPAIAVSSGSTVEYFDANSPVLRQAWFQQTEQYMVIQDDQSKPIIFDGSTSRRAKPGEIPTGSAMAYGRGRLWVAVNQGRDYVAGDIVGGPTGVLGYTENTFLAGGGAFHVPLNAGRIRAMKFVMNLDTSLGQGPLQVLCDRAIFSCNAPTVREQWAVMTDPIQTVSMINFGGMSHAGTVVVNGDLFYRARDGIRSFIIARRDFGMWGNTPISREMRRILDNDTQALLVHSSGVYFDNRLLMTCTPQPGLNGIRHKGIVALDFDRLTTMQQKAPPAYDGLWTGINPTVLVTGLFGGTQRCFAFAIGRRATVPGEPEPELDDVRFYDGQNQLFEILKQDNSSMLLDNGCRPVDWVIESKSFSFPRAGGLSGLKSLEGAEVWVSEFHKQVDFTLQYRPDQHPCWEDWANKTICVKSDQCDEEADGACDSITAGNMMGFKTRLSFGKPADGNNTADEKAINVGYSFQLRLSGSGYAELNRIVMYAHEKEEWGISPPSDDRTTCSTISCCPPDPFEYESIFGTPDAPLIRSDYLGTGTTAFYWFADAEGEGSEIAVVDSAGTTLHGVLADDAGIQKYNLPNPPSSFTLSARVTNDHDSNADCSPKTSPTSSDTLNL